jgi:hypothetical protein
MCCSLTSQGGSVTSPQRPFMTFFFVSRRKTTMCFWHREQEECLEYNSKGEHYANVYTSDPRPCDCRICWLHHVSE